MADKQTLPTTIISKSDLARLKNELDILDDALHQHKLKKSDDKTEFAKPSATLLQVAEAFGFDVKKQEDRSAFQAWCEQTLSSAPVIHISFASAPKPAFLQKIASWFREQIHPTALIQVGLQPGIAAGCIIRTPNKQFDFSLRHFLQAKSDLLVQQVRGQSER